MLHVYLIIPEKQRLHLFWWDYIKLTASVSAPPSMHCSWITANIKVSGKGCETILIFFFFFTLNKDCKSTVIIERKISGLN